MDEARNLKILENCETLKEAIAMVIEALEIEVNNFLMVNISYREELQGSGLYPGLEYIKNARAGIEKTFPVIFYGFESPENLRRRSEASILQSPAVHYIQLPCQILGLNSAIKQVSGRKAPIKALDKETEREIAIERISGFKHDLRNAAILLNQPVAGLKADSEERRKEKWHILGQFSNDFIEKRTKRYDQIREIIESSFKTNKSILSIPKLLKKATDLYSDIKQSVDENDFNEETVSNIVKNGAEAIGLINKVERILEKIQNG